MTTTDDLLDKVRVIIEREGWAVQAVGGENPGEQFHYSVGLATRGYELWVAGLPYERGAQLINLVGGRILAGLPMEGPLDLGWSVQFRLRGPIDPADAEVNVAAAINGEVWPTVMQILWPDPAGLFPDEDGYDTLMFPQRLPKETP